MTKMTMTELLHLACENDKNLACAGFFLQCDNMEIGSPLGPFLANKLNEFDSKVAKLAGGSVSPLCGRYLRCD